MRLRGCQPLRRDSRCAIQIVEALITAPPINVECVSPYQSEELDRLCRRDVGDRKGPRQAVVSGHAQQPGHQKTEPLPGVGRLPEPPGHGQAEQGDGQRLPEHDHLDLFVPRQRLGHQIRRSEDRAGCQHQQVVDTGTARELRPDHDHHAAKSDHGGQPALPAHGLSKEQVGAQHDEDRPGEPDGRGVGQRYVRQRREPQHQPGRVDGATGKLSTDPAGPVCRHTGPRDQRQHDDYRRQIAQKLRLHRVQLQTERAQQGVQHHEQESRQARPHQAVHGGRQPLDAAHQEQGAAHQGMPQTCPAVNHGCPVNC
jgi:hypothetical protein